MNSSLTAIEQDIHHLEKKRARLLSENERIMKMRAEEMRAIGEQLMRAKQELRSYLNAIEQKKKELTELSETINKIKQGAVQLHSQVLTDS